MTGWKDWQIGEVVTESDFQNLVQDQVVQRYADASARSTTLGTAVAEGMVSYLESTSKVEVYDGSSWVQVGQEGDITSVTAGTGLTGGGTAGDVTLNADYAAIGSAVSITASQVTDLTASAAAINTIDDGTAGYTALSNGTAGISYQPVSHNYIINGAFDVWQRGTSITYTGITYGADRWSQGIGATSTITFSRQTFTPGDIEAIGHGDAQYYARLTTDTRNSSSYTQIVQKIEDVRTLAGQTATLSFWARATGSFDALAYLAQRFPGGSSTVFYTESFTMTTSWQRYSFTFTLGSLAGKSIGTGGDNLEATIRQTVTADGNSFDIWGVQLEAGSVATPFKRHAPSLQGELAACQRYYWRQTASNVYTNYAAGYATSTNILSYFNFQPPVQMRVPPTSIDYLNIAIGRTLLSGPFAISAASLVASSLGKDGFSISTTHTSSGYTAFTGQDLIADFTTNSYIGFSAEL